MLKQELPSAAVVDYALHNEAFELSGNGNQAPPSLFSSCCWRRLMAPQSLLSEPSSQRREL